MFTIILEGLELLFVVILVLPVIGLCVDLKREDKKDIKTKR